jgi:hypothetical protein
MTARNTTDTPAAQSHRFRRTWIWIAALILGAVLVSRVTVHFGYINDDKKEVAERIDEFHTRMNLMQFDQIYNDADPAFRASLRREEWSKHMQDTRERYGAFRNSAPWKMNVVMGAPVQIRAAYTSNFEKGNATELFAFAREGHRIQLLAYGIYPADATDEQHSSRR